MNERALYPEIEHTCDAYNLYWKKTQDLRFENPAGRVVDHASPDAIKKPPTNKGEADFIWMNRDTGRSALVEIKRASKQSRYTYFAFNDIDEDQRWFLDKHKHLSYIWLSMGIRIGGKDNPRTCWLIPWLKWLDYEQEWTAAGLAGMNYSKPKELRHREMGLFATNVLFPWELKNNGSAGWGWNALHPINSLFVE